MARPGVVAMGGGTGLLLPELLLAVWYPAEPEDVLLPP